MAAFSEIIAENFFSQVELTGETAGPKHIRAQFPIDQIAEMYWKGPLPRGRGSAGYYECGKSF